MIRDIHSENIGTVAKSFTANNQQNNQEHLTVEISESILNEIYFPALRIAIEKGKPVDADRI